MHACELAAHSIHVCACALQFRTVLYHRARASELALMYLFPVWVVDSPAPDAPKT